MRRMSSLRPKDSCSTTTPGWGPGPSAPKKSACSVEPSAVGTSRRSAAVMLAADDSQCSKRAVGASGAEPPADMRMQTVVLFGVGAREALDLVGRERGGEGVRPAKVEVAVVQLLADLRKRVVGVVDALYVQRDVLA